jgi:uncharacterized protein with FMN-binding domain
MSLQAFIQRQAQQQQREAAEIANSTALTLEQVLANIRNTQHPSHHRSLRAQAAAWYKQGYYMRSNNAWYSNVEGVVRRKYSTV